MAAISDKMDQAREQGGIIGRIRRIGLGARAGLVFAGLYLMPVKKNDLPDTSRLYPVW